MTTIEIIIALLIGVFCGALADILVKRYYSRKRKKEKEPVIILPMYNTLCMYSKSKYVRKASFGHEQNLGETICENNPLLSI